MAEQSLKKRTLTGVTWSAIDNFANLGIGFLVGIILARILTPEEFGIIGMITIFMAISNSFIDSGFSNALIRKTDAKQIDYDTVFYFNLLLGVLCFAILFFTAPAISRFFNEPILIPITRTMGSLLIINALGIIQRTILVKRIDFKTQTKISFIASISSGIIGIGMALNGFGVWSLVGQQISRQLLNSLFLWVFNSWRPKWEFSKNSFKELWGFGSNLLAAGLIETIYKNIYYVVIGRFYSTGQLGQYTRAEQFKRIFSSNLTTIIQRVSYPVLSEVQNHPERLTEGYKKILKCTMLVTSAAMLGLAAIAKPLILILIGSKWGVASEYLQIICFSAILHPLHAINLNILKVKGRSDLFLKLEIIKTIIATVPICLGIFYGIKVMLVSSVFVSFLCYFLNSYYSAQLINYSTRSQLLDILPTFFVSLLVSLVMWSISFLPMSIYWVLPLQLVVGLVLAVIIYNKIQLEEYIEVKSFILSFIKKK